MAPETSFFLRGNTRFQSRQENTPLVRQYLNLGSKTRTRAPTVKLNSTQRAELYSVLTLCGRIFPGRTPAANSEHRRSRRIISSTGHGPGASGAATALFSPRTADRLEAGGGAGRHRPMTARCVIFHHLEAAWQRGSNGWIDPPLSARNDAPAQAQGRPRPARTPRHIIASRLSLRFRWQLCILPGCGCRQVAA